VSDKREKEEENEPVSEAPQDEKQEPESQIPDFVKEANLESLEVKDL